MEDFNKLLTVAYFFLFGSATIIFFGLIINYSAQKEAKSFLKRLIIFLISAGTIKVAIKISLQYFAFLGIEVYLLLIIAIIFAEYKLFQRFVLFSKNPS